MMEQLSQQEEMQVNRLLAKEFITQHLDIRATEQNIEKLAKFIFQLEQEERHQAP